MRKKAKQELFNALSGHLQSRVDVLAGENANDPFFMHQDLPEALTMLVGYAAQSEEVAGHILNTLDNLIEDKAVEVARNLIEHVKRDADAHDACERLKAGLNIFLNLTCMTQKEPAIYRTELGRQPG